MATIGYATLSVIPEISGITGNLSRQLGGPLVDAGRRAGQDAGQAVAGGIAQAQAAVDAATAKLAKSQDKVADAAGKVRVAEAQLQALRDRGVTDAGRLAAATERVQAARRRETQATRDAETAATSLTRAQERAANATDEVGESTGRFRERLSALGANVDGNAKKLAGMAAATVSVGSAMALVSQSMDFEKSNDKLAASLGATPAMAAEMGAVAGRLYADAYGENMGQVSESIGAVVSELQFFGVSSEADIERVTAKALDFSGAFGTEITESVSGVRNLLYQGLAPDADAAFDMMTAAFQKVPESMRAELPEIIAEYGTNFRALGFEGEEAFNLLIGASLEGKFALDKTGDALKEFTIRGSDMSKTSVDAYESVGLNAQIMSDRIAAGGDGAQAALQETAEAILGIEDPALRANTAIALFGTPIEDLSVDQIPAFLSTLGGIPDYMGEVSGATDRMSSTLNDNAATSLESVKRSIQGGFLDALQSSAVWITENQGLAQGLAIGVGALGAAWLTYKAVMIGVQLATSAAAGVAAAGTAAAWVASAATTAAAWVSLRVEATAIWLSTQAGAVTSALATSAAWVASTARTIAALALQGAAFVAQKAIMAAGAIATGVMTAAQWALNAALSANPIGLIIAALAALVAGVVIAYQNSETFRAVVQAAWEGIQAAVSFAWNSVIKPVFDMWWAGVQKAGEVVTWLWNNAVQPAFDGIGNLISGVWNNVISPSFEAMKTGFGAVGDFFGGVANVIQGVWDGIVNGIKSAVRMIGGLLARLKNVPGLSWVGDAGEAMLNWAGGSMPEGNFGNTVYRPEAGGHVGGRAMGGLISGPGTGTSDSITANLSNGEYVVRASATKRNLPLLQALNAGWVPPAGLLHEMLPGFANGGLVSTDDLTSFAMGVEGQPYEWGGVNWGDCSGAVSAIANYATGRDPFGSRFATMTMDSELAARGFLPGLGPAGSLNVGWYNGGPYGGHTAATLPNGVNFEMGGQRGDGQYGGIAAGAADSMFTDHAHLPPDFFLGGDAMPSGVGDIPGGLSSGGGGGWSAPSTGGGGSAMGGGGGASSGGSGGSPSGSTPGGSATPVFVTNWPNGTPGTTGQAPAAESYTPGGTGAAPAYTGEKAASWQEETSKNFQTGMAGAGQAFLEGQLSGMPFGDTIGKVRDRGHEITIIVQDMHEAISKIRTLDAQKALAPGSRF